MRRAVPVQNKHRSSRSRKNSQVRGLSDAAQIPTHQSNTYLSWIAAVAIVAATCLVYLPAFRAGFIWDDDSYLTQNETLRTADGLRQIWFEPRASPQYYPLVFTTFWIEYHLWGLDPAGYHIVNVLLHGFSAVVLWRVLRRLELPGVFLAAILFAIHPVHVESVAWITERKNVLSGLFYLLALKAYLGFSGVSGVEPALQSQRRNYIASLVFFICALLSKTVTASLPVIILLILWWKRGRLRLSDFVPLVPMFALGLAMGLTTVWLEVHHVGAKGEAFELSAIGRVLVASRATWFYFFKLLLPVDLTFIYPRWNIDPSVVWQYLPLACLAALLGLLWSLRSRLGRGAFVAALIFIATLAPALGFFNVYPFQYSFVADHFQYLASIAVLTGFAALMVTILRRVPAPPRGVLLALPPIILAGLTLRQTNLYADLETLWRDVLRKNDSAWMAHDNLAAVLLGQGKAAEAKRHYERAVELWPGDYKAFVGLGNIAATSNQLPEATAHFREALRIEPNETATHTNLASALAQQGLFAQAIPHLEEVAKQKPDDVSVYIRLGYAFDKSGEQEKAIENLRKAIQMDPNRAEAHFLLSELLRKAGKAQEADEHLRRAQTLRPDLRGP